ncbi:MAG: hypothetical protein Q7R79_00160, partial [bacterium]|nr:hypothetical protein [bacterium]
MTQKNKTVLDCTHDSHDPEHIVCIKREGKKKSAHSFVAYMDDRYDRFYHPRHSHRHVHRIVDSLLVASIALLIGFLIFSFVYKESDAIRL